LTGSEQANTNGPAHTRFRFWHKLENQRGNMGMTWGIKVQKVAFALAVFAALALAAGADWINAFAALDW